MKDYQKALGNLYKCSIKPSKQDIILLQELVHKNAILMNDNIQNLLKSFLPYEEPYCSSCMFYTESDCDTKNKCYLKMLFKALDWSEDNER